jgi:hypothetical protein
MERRRGRESRVSRGSRPRPLHVATALGGLSWIRSNGHTV